MSDIPDRKGAWSSGLSTNDFAACVTSGLHPLGFVQGCSVVSWSFYGMRYSALNLGYGANRPSGYFEQYNCPHGIVSAEHRMYGLNYQKTWLEQAWTNALEAATARLTDEAARLGAHGIIGVLDRSKYHPETTTFEFSLSGTAVGVDDIPVPSKPFTTFLAGQKLNKLVEAGFAPVEIAMSICAVGVMSSCITEYQLRGAGAGAFGLGAGNWGGTPTGEIDQLARAQAAARSVVRDRIRAQLGGDVLHGASLDVRTHESQEGPQIEATLRGNRVRSFKEYDKMEPPRPVVRLLDR